MALELTYDQKFLALGADIPPNAPPVPTGLNYVLSKQIGDVLYLSGCAPFWGNDIPEKFKGKLGQDLTVDQGYAASKLTGINLLWIIRDVVTSLDNVVEVIEVNGMVNCIPTFYNQSDVINGCSDLMVSIFGDQGKHIRSAVGMSSLAMNIAVEISTTVRIR